MALVIKTHQNNKKKNRNFFGEGPGPINLFWGKPVLFIFYSLKKLFEEMGEDHGPSRSPLPPSLRIVV